MTRRAVKSKADRKRKAKTASIVDTKPTGKLRADSQVPARAVDWVNGKAPDPSQARRPIAAIKFGKRHRKDMGDLVALARSINEKGLLHPVVIDHENKLIAGERRIRAWQLSIFRAEPIPVHVVPLSDIVGGEWAENDPQLRKNFTYSEVVAIKQVIEAKLKPAALQRKAEAGRNKKKRDDEPLRAADRAAAFTGKSRRTIEKAEKIIAAAKVDPVRYGKLVEAIDKSGRVDGPFKRLQVTMEAVKICLEPPPLPDQGPYRGVVIDFPWAAEMGEDDADRLKRGYYPYATMGMSQILAFCERAKAIFHQDCVIALWIPNFHLARGYHVDILKALGVQGVTICTWVKNMMGRGQVLRGKTEHAVIATAGKPVIEVGNLTTEFHANVDRKRHSLKPMMFYRDIFEKLVAAPRYASLFETELRGPKWDCHGDKMMECAASPLIPSVGDMQAANGVPA